MNTHIRWKYTDSRGLEHVGYLKARSQGQGSDVTYQFVDEKTEELSVVSGSLLKKAERIWE